MVKMSEVMTQIGAEIERLELESERLRKMLRTMEAFVRHLSPEELDSFEKTISKIGEIRKAFGGNISSDADTRDEESLKPKRQRGELPPSEVALAVRDILLRVRRPMRRGELVAELEKLGVPLAGRDKNKNLGTILWRHKNEFIQIDNLGYWLKDAPLEGVYTPQE